MSSSMVGDGVILIGVILAATMLSQGFITSMTSMERSSMETSKYLSERIKTNVDVILMQESGSAAKIWVKNIGSTQIGETEIKASNLFFGKGEVRCYLWAASGAGWTYTILSGSAHWNPNETIELLLTPIDPLAPGQYYFSFVTHNGVKAEYTFSIA